VTSANQADQAREDGQERRALNGGGPVPVGVPVGTRFGAPGLLELVRGDDVDRMGWPAGSADRREAVMQARRLQADAKAAKVLWNPGAWASIPQIADAICILHQLLEGWDPAIRAVQAVILRTARQLAHQRAHPELPIPAFPGRAVRFFRRSWEPAPGKRGRPSGCGPRICARSPWWIAGIEERWDVAGWVPMPDLSEVPGWIPATDLDQLTLGPADPGPAELRARIELERDQAAGLEDWHRYNAELQAADDDPGRRTMRALLRGELSARAADVLADWGPDYMGTLLRWQTQARRGSERAAGLLLELDRAHRDGRAVLTPQELYPPIGRARAMIGRSGVGAAAAALLASPWASEVSRLEREYLEDLIGASVADQVTIDAVARILARGLAEDPAGLEGTI
jgi:hypothetical protein